MPFKNIFIKFRNISNLIYGILGFLLGIVLLSVKDYLWGVILIAISGFLVYRNYKKLKKNKRDVPPEQKIIKETAQKTIYNLIVKKIIRPIGADKKVL